MVVGTEDLSRPCINDIIKVKIQIPKRQEETNNKKMLRFLWREQSEKWRKCCSTRCSICGPQFPFWSWFHVKISLALDSYIWHIFSINNSWLVYYLPIVVLLIEEVIVIQYQQKKVLHIW